MKLMDLQPSGNKQIELISIETEKLYFTVKGKHESSNFNYSEDVTKDSFYCQCSDENELIKAEVLKEQPIFYEYQNYQIIIEDKGNHEIRFYHESKHIREQIAYTTPSKRVLSGSINFMSDIGLTELIILVNGEAYLKVRIEVFPKKIDYKKDYHRMLEEVNDEIYNLSFEFLKRTYLNMSISSKEGNSLTEYYSILRVIYSGLIQSIKTVMNQPHHALMKESSVVSVHKSKKVNEQTIKWLSKNVNHYIKLEDRMVPTKILQVKKNLTVDTYENQFLKYMLLTIVSKLEDLKRKYSKLDRAKDEIFTQNLSQMIKEIRSFTNETFLKNVGRYEFKDSFSLVLKMAPGYKEIYKYYLMLRKGLTMHGDIFRLSMKDLALLYEYWCFIKINNLLRNKYKMIKNTMIKVNTNGVFVTLKKGSHTEVTYQNPRNGEIFTVSYNLGMSSKTVAQRPDNIFSMEKNGAKIRYNYIFDAKYRINSAKIGTTYKQYYHTPGPEEDDINTMHRYRDAIVYEHKEQGNVERNIFGAFVLFPYEKEDEYANHNFYKSIELVNVGGIPFLPGSTALMESFLDELIEESSLSSYERSLGQVGKNYYLEKSYFDDRTVLVGSLSSKEQLEINLNHKFYHTKLSNVDLDKHLIKTIAIGQSKKLFGEEMAGIRYYGKVKRIQIVERRDINEIPKDSDELYIKFEIEEWKTLQNPLRVEGFQVIRVMYTTDYLLHHTEIVSELCIRSEEEFRLWMELKRIDEKSEAIIGRKSLEDRTTIEGFSIGDKQIFFLDDKLRVIKGEKVYHYLRKDFRKNPKLVVRMIREDFFDDERRL